TPSYLVKYRHAKCSADSHSSYSRHGLSERSAVDRDGAIEGRKDRQTRAPSGLVQAPVVRSEERALRTAARSHPDVSGRDGDVAGNARPRTKAPGPRAHTARRQAR